MDADFPIQERSTPWRCWSCCLIFWMSAVRLVLIKEEIVGVSMIPKYGMEMLVHLYGRIDCSLCFREGDMFNSRIIDLVKLTL